LGTLSTYSISGRVSAAGDKPIAGVTVSVTGGSSAVTDAAGEYTLSDLLPGAYTLMASKSGYSFAPTSMEVNLPPAASGQDFVGRPLVYLPLVAGNHRPVGCQAGSSSLAKAPGFARLLFSH